MINPWMKEYWNITEQGRYAEQYGLEAARSAAEEAGVKVGATRPEGEPKSRQPYQRWQPQYPQPSRR